MRLLQMEEAYSVVNTLRDKEPQTILTIPEADNLLAPFEEAVDDYTPNSLIVWKLAWKLANELEQEEWLCETTTGYARPMDMLQSAVSAIERYLDNRCGECGSDEGSHDRYCASCIERMAEAAADDAADRALDEMKMHGRRW